MKVDDYAREIASEIRVAISRARHSPWPDLVLHDATVTSTNPPPSVTVLFSRRSDPDRVFGFLLQEFVNDDGMAPREWAGITLTNIEEAFDTGRLNVGDAAATGKIIWI